MTSAFPLGSRADASPTTRLARRGSHLARTAIATSFLACSLAFAADAPPVPVSPAADKQACKPVKGFGDVLDVDCGWTPAAAPQRLSFKATFGGSHDDTIVKIEPRLNGQPLACEPGSKTRADFEDGEVTLQCLFTVASTGTPQALAVKVVWSHAQYMDYEFGVSR